MRNIIFLLLVTLIVSCEKEKYRELEAQFLELSCCSDLLGKEYIIENDSLLNYLKSQCSKLSFPEIDFNYYTLLAIPIDIGCDDELIRHIYKDDINQKYIYNIEVHTGTCKMLAIFCNWAIVPKLPSGYAVEFNVKNL